jgi:hypothetical protein
MLGSGVAWLGIPRARAPAPRVAAVVLIGSVLGVAANDRWGLVNDESLSWLWAQLAVMGVFFAGAGWLLLGAVLVSGGRGGSRATA